jgi:hypothetical protein
MNYQKNEHSSNISIMNKWIGRDSFFSQLDNKQFFFQKQSWNKNIFNIYADKKN